MGKRKFFSFFDKSENKKMARDTKNRFGLLVSFRFPSGSAARCCGAEKKNARGFVIWSINPSRGFMWADRAWGVTACLGPYVSRRLFWQTHFFLRSFFAVFR